MMDPRDNATERFRDNIIERDMFGNIEPRHRERERERENVRERTVGENMANGDCRSSERYERESFRTIKPRYKIGTYIYIYI